jgi:hypothetical protein
MVGHHTQTMKSISRRTLLKSSILGGTGLLGANLLQACNSRNPITTQKPLLVAENLEFLGAFRLPRDVSGEDGGWGRGLAMRFKDGKQYFFSTTVKNSVYEVSNPGLTKDNYPLAEISRFWGNVYGDKRILNPSASETRNDGSVYGLFFDARDQRLYWSYGDGYNTISGRDPSIGCSSLNDADGTSQAIGAWSLKDWSCKAAMGGMLEIPAWFADAYCQGRRLAAGFGGYFSIATVGPISAGPALSAFSPQDCSASSHNSSVLNTPLLGYPFHGEPYTNPDRAHRDTDYSNEFDHWNPKNGTGYWSWTDWVWQGAVWVDTPEVHGLLVLPTLGNGRTWYETSTLHAERASHWWYVYDPNDLAEVAQGKRQTWEVQAKNTWQANYPNVALQGWRDEPLQMVTGACFDPTSKRVFVAVRHTWVDGNPNFTGTTVYGYQIHSP